MTTLGDFTERVRRAVDDEITEGVDPFYSTDLLTDAITAAHKAVLPWHPKLAKATLTEDGVYEGVFPVPSDFYGIDGLRDDENGKFLPSVKMRAQDYLGEDVTGNEFYLYPNGYLTLAKEPDSGDTFTLYYRAYWAVPTASSGTMEIPSKLEDALLFYCCHYILSPEGVSSASIRQWNTRADSGNPEHNPVAERSEHFLRMFEIAVTRHQAHIPGET